MLTQVANFGSDASGLEKILRLLQALCMVAVAVLFPNNPVVGNAVRAREQFNLGRRFLKFFKCVPMLQSSVAGKAFGAEGLVSTAEMARNAFMGLYMVIESATLLDFMGVYPVSWAAPAMLEANRFWFYSLSISVFLSLYQFFNVPSTPIPTASSTSASEKDAKAATVDEKTKKDVKKQRSELKWKYAKEAVMYGVDLLLPGAATGWIKTEPLYVAVAMVTSTVLAMEGIWKRVNGVQA